MKKNFGNSYILCFVFCLECVSYKYYINIIIIYNVFFFSFLSFICRELFFLNNFFLVFFIVCFRKGLWLLIIFLILLVVIVMCLLSFFIFIIVCEWMIFIVIISEFWRLWVMLFYVLLENNFMWWFENGIFVFLKKVKVFWSVFLVFLLENVV